MTNISLKRKKSKRDYDKLHSTLPKFFVELYLSYTDMGDKEALIDKKVK